MRSDPARPLILVTGGSGYIASRLIPRLLDSGYRVRVLVRHKDGMTGRPWLDRVDLVEADTAYPETLPAALQGVHTLMYLIHNMSRGSGYAAVERSSAHAMLAAAEAAGAKHIIYLGGLANPHGHTVAPHMRSRMDTGKALREGSIPVTEFRAGVIVGPGSISFEMIRFLTEFFPVLPGPAWLRNETQPIAASNVIDYLCAAIEASPAQSRVYEIGGTDRLQYRDLMLRYAAARGLRRLLLTIPGVPVSLMAFVVARVTPVPYRIAKALIGALQSDSVATEDAALSAFPGIRLLGLDEAVGAALNELHPDRVVRVWQSPSTKPVHTRHEGFLIDMRCLDLDTDVVNALELVRRTVVQREVTSHMELDAGNRIRAQMPVAGRHKLWVEWQATGDPGSRCKLEQTTFFAPSGATGLYRWWLTRRRAATWAGRIASQAVIPSS